MECLADKTKNRFEIKKKKNNNNNKKFLVNHSSLKGKRLKLVNSIKIFDSCLMLYRDY